MPPLRVPPPAGAARRRALGALLALLAAACVTRQTRRPGSDMVNVRPTIDLVGAIVRTQCQRPPGATVVGDSLGRRQSCPVTIGDSLSTEPGRPTRQQPPQRVP